MYKMPLCSGSVVNGKNNLCKTALFLLPLVLILCVFTSCHKINGDGPLVRETRDIRDFSGIEISISGVLKYTPDSLYKIEITAQRNIQPVIETTVKNGILEIGLKNGTRLGSYKPVEIAVHAPDISSLGISGSANAFILKPLHTHQLALNISGSGNIQTNDLVIEDQLSIVLSGSGSVFVKGMESRLFDLDISGSGDILANEGNIHATNMRISGSGKIDVSSVEAQTAKVRSSGSGNIRLNVSKTLEVHISGSGNVYYKGNPQITAQISGSGKIMPF